MAIPPSARGRKNRLVREGESPRNWFSSARATATQDGKCVTPAKTVELINRLNTPQLDHGLERGLGIEP